MTSTVFLALHVVALTLGVIGIVPTNGPPWVLAFLLPFSLAHAVRRWGMRRALLAFVATYVITFVAELWGTTQGLFGAHYAYDVSRWTPLSEPLLLAIVPCMWFMMMIPSHAIARALVGERAGHVVVALVGGLVMTGWDVALDPVSVGAGLWSWSGGTAGPGGIPLENYASWWMGSTIVIAVYSLVERRGADGPARRSLEPVLAYGAVALFYLVTAPGAIKLAAVAMAVPAVLAIRAGRPRRETSDPVLRIDAEWLEPPSADAIKALRRQDFLWNPVKNHFVNSLHIVVAHGERYMIANMRRVRDRLRSPYLRRQLEWFVEQEGKHATEHRRFAAHLGRLGYRTDRLDRLCRWVGHKLLPGLFGPSMNMAITVAIEHWTACVAELVLRDRLLADLDPAARRLVEWHCFEELEHRAVAFDVFQDVSGSYLVRVLGMLVGVQLIAMLSLYGLVSFLAQDGQIFKWRAWREGLKFFYLQQALVPRTLPRALRLLSPWFHPTSALGVEMVTELRPEAAR